MSKRDSLPTAIQRGRLRLKIGSLYFSCLRYASWYRPAAKFARKRNTRHRDIDAFPFITTSHASPLFRPLKNVDMWLQHNKVHNLSLAIQRLNGVVLRPGETFSFWRLVGRPSRMKGYLPGMVLVNGGFQPGTGGGLCQLTNLVYWMTLHTPLTIVERFRHQYDVFPDANRTLPFRSGATVSYNYIDLQIRNETLTAFKLHLFLDDAKLYGEWRSPIPRSVEYNVYERYHRITQNTYGHYLRHNEIWRSIWNPESETLQEERIAENHALMMYSPLLESAPSDT